MGTRAMRPSGKVFDKKLRFYCFLKYNPDFVFDILCFGFMSNGDRNLNIS